MDKEATSRGFTGVRALVLLVAAAIAGPLVCIIVRAVGLSLVSAILVSAAVLLLAAPGLWRVLPTGLATSGRWPRVVFAAWIVLTATAAYRLGHMGVFMLNASASDHAISPEMRAFDDPQMSKPFFEKHNCFTSYAIGAHLARAGVENIYDARQYRDPETETVIHKTIGDALTIDRYQYPPPFLILPWAMQAAGADFFQMRAIWFSLNVLVFCATSAAVATWLGGPRFNVYWLAWPMVLLPQATLVALQIGNVHFFIITLAVASLLAFASGRDRLGGAVLGYLIVSKIFPGVLLAYLLCRRRWRAVAWTGVSMVACTLIALLIFGVQPFEAFVTYQLPRLASGEAFSFATEHLRPIVSNLSVMGIAYKLEKLGLIGGLAPEGVARGLTWLYTAGLVLTIVLAGMRHHRQGFLRRGDGDSPTRRLAMATMWFVLLILGQMRSPFLPWGYGNMVVLWLMALLLPTRHAGWWRVPLVFGAWLVFSPCMPLPWGPPEPSLDLVYTLVATVAILVTCGVLVMRALRVAASPA